MKALLDTSVIVAALCPPHQFHAACLPWLESARGQRFKLVATAHCLAEAYAVLTRRPVKPKLAERDVWQVIRDNVVGNAELIDVPAQVYCDFIEDLSQRNLGGGVVYDRLIAAAAELAKVDFLVTRNVRHFQDVWPAGAGRIISPLFHAAP